ncbi:MAG TPA: thiamine pyrophosphate-dependent enzyme [Elusimicrobiota bacterium]|nr:thiamine pyrophosphate-dependent enzyme [Elusimicrobiota bacterium]
MDNRFLKESGFEAFTGNELLLKGALEGGVALFTGYPGSPISEIFDNVSSVSEHLSEKGILALMANNEGLSAARLNGARMVGLRAMAVMKSVGMHVAADGLAVGNLAETRRPEGGALIVVGDDPWNETTQINSDSRFLSQHLHMPVMEPSTFQEIKDWIDTAFELSGLSDLYVTYVITTNQADGGGGVQLRPNKYPPINTLRKSTLSSAELPVDHLVMIPPHTSWREATLRARHDRFIKSARDKGINRIVHSAPAAPLGFVTAGLPYCYLEQALRDMGLEGRFPILKMGVSYPLDTDLVLEFSKTVKQIVVVEEKRPFLENQVTAELHRAGQNRLISSVPPIWGKSFPQGFDGIPGTRGINASVLVEHLAPLFLNGFVPLSDEERAAVQRAYQTVRDTAAVNVKIPVRTPTFCPGCPHRDSSSVCLTIKKNLLDPEYMMKQYRMGPVDVIFNGESGCHSMLQFEPNLGLMQNYSGMGLGGGTGAGMAPFIKNKQVVFVGDSTFFHSGMIAISDSIKNRQDITYIILENKTTAMTGHQPTPGNDQNIMREKTFAQSIEMVIKGMARESVPVFRVNPAFRDSYRSLLENLILKDGTKVIIADKECGITYHRRVKRERKRVLKTQGYLPEEKLFNLNTDVCENCLECATGTGCPGLTVENTARGKKMALDKSLCVSDGACTKAKVCPSFEEIVIHRKQPVPTISVQETALPLPPKKPFQDFWNCYIAAVGGMGAGVVTACLVRAGLREGFKVLFADKKGLAIRNGGVYGHVIMSTKDRIYSPIITYGQADLLLGIDILESVRGLDPTVNLRMANPRRTTAIVNTHKIPTIMTLIEKTDFNVDELQASLKAHTNPERYLGMDFSVISEAVFGSKLYCNILLLGAAFQKGLLPVSLENLLWAIEVTVPNFQREDNLKAFQVGRQVAFSPGAFSFLFPRPQSYRDVVQERSDFLRKNHILRGKKLSSEYRKLMEDAVRWMTLPESENKKLAVYVYDLIQHGGLSYAHQYVERLWRTFKKDRDDKKYGVTLAVLENAYRVMLVKDEFYVAGLLSSYEKYRDDRRRYEIDPARGDTVQYVHLTRPYLPVGPWRFEFDLKSRPWQLKIMKHLSFLRRMIPQWHQRENDYRDWYLKMVDEFAYHEDDQVYSLYEQVYRSPETVRGFREIRYSKIDEARRKAEEKLAAARDIQAGKKSQRV